MTRGLPAEVASAALADTVRPFFAVELLFDSPNELRFWTGLGDIVYDGETYTGAGELMQISEVQESSDIAARGATLTMSGIPSNLLNLAVDEPYQGRIAKIKFGIFTTAPGPGNLLVSDTEYLLVDTDTKLDINFTSSFNMFDLFVGRMDQMTIDDGADTATIALTVESKLIDLERPRIRRYSDENQQSRFSGDLAFEFVSRLQDESLTWGS